ncbi:hypothetical protein [Nocardioides limicola]|uniref:hypothetical protein n=1 Tax=Nocardioides limicola TaxID=2803368 RepID=UPI00193BBDDC|nr:hypothetical protein [Nocardioides sp. DJM-14]
MADEYCSYAEFGRAFFEVAVSRERVEAGIDFLAGQPIDFGPIGVGPGKLAKVAATGKIGAATVTTVPGDEVTFMAALPVSLEFTVDLQVETHRFTADLTVPLLLTAKAMHPPALRLEVTAPRARDIELELRASGLRGSLLQRVVGMEVEVKRFVARYVAREVSKPHVEKARTIDVAAAIEQAWSSSELAQETSRTVTDDLTEAIRTDLVEHLQAE